MTELVDQSLAFLRDAGVELSDGLSQAELDAIQHHFQFEFGPDHRELLSKAVPIGEGWYDWRDILSEDLATMLKRPIDGVLFDVANGGFWPSSWGVRPSEESSALEIAGRHLAGWPKLVPLFSHRFMPAAPSMPRAPVLSVYQTDVIFYGQNLFDYVRAEFGSLKTRFYDPHVDWAHLLPPWSLLANGNDVP